MANDFRIVDDALESTVEGILKLSRKDPNYRAKVAAKIKRLIHLEKLDVYERIEAQFTNGFAYDEIHKLIKVKIATHEEWSNKSDKDIVSWRVDE